MAFLFPDDPAPRSRPANGRPPARKFPPRPKAVPTELAPLGPGWILAHCDGGARGNPGPAGFGAVLADEAGMPLAELSEFLGFKTNNFAEYSGLLAVLAWALEHGHNRLRVVSDSELMVKQIQGKYKVNSPDLRPLFEEARRRIARLDGFEIHHALRHKNKDADRLANEAMDRGMGKPAGGAAPQATPYPKPGGAPAAPASFGGVREQMGLGQAARAAQAGTGAQTSAQAPEAQRAMLRGFVRDGVVHLLGGTKLPDGSFVKILPE